VALASIAVTMGGLFALQRQYPVRTIAWVVLIGYTVLVSLAVHYTGGPLTPFPAVYLVIVLAASFLLGRRGATVIALLSITCYALILYLEYIGVLSMVQIWRIAFSPRERGPLLIINWITLTIPTLVTAQLAGTLAERLKETNRHLRESERLRQNLSDMIVHDLRNPLTSLMGGLDVMQMTMGERMTPDQIRMLENAQHSGHALLNLVGELLDISKMEAGQFKLDLEPTNVHRLLEENARSVRALAQLDEQTVETVEAQVDTVTCDRQLITRVVANLVSNAMKHTPAGGTIILAATQQPDEGLVTISVTDTGVGIPAEYLDSIFDKFSQVDKPGNVRQGTGLGLTFCKMAVEAHGGRIWVESEVGKGSTFAFSLPLRPHGAKPHA
jgi:signal transduction histidine kinase